jgi:hypothetical protein
VPTVKAQSRNGSLVEVLPGSRPVTGVQVAVPPVEDVISTFGVAVKSSGSETRKYWRHCGYSASSHS